MALPATESVESLPPLLDALQALDVAHEHAAMAGDAYAAVKGRLHALDQEIRSLDLQQRRTLSETTMLAIRERLDVLHNERSLVKDELNTVHLQRQHCEQRAMAQRQACLALAERAQAALLGWRLAHHESEHDPLASFRYQARIKMSTRRKALEGLIGLDLVAAILDRGEVPPWHATALQP